MSLSIVVPVFNQRDDVSHLYWELIKVLDTQGREFEILFVDDGSTDGTTDRLRRIAAEDQRVRLVLFRRQFGPSAAIKAGFDMACHDVIVTINGNRLDDPADIPQMLAKLDEGYDLVHGRRRQRSSAASHQVFAAKLGCWIVARATGQAMHDLDCTLNVIHREYAQELNLHGETHRFIPILAGQAGARCVEVETSPRAPTVGETERKLTRFWRAMLDLVTVKYLVDYLDKPMRLFGSLGLWSFAASLGAMVALAGMKLVGAVPLAGNPLGLFSLVAAAAGLQFITLGLLGEAHVHMFFTQAEQPLYRVREKVNFVDEADQAEELPMTIPFIIDTGRRAA